MQRIILSVLAALSFTTIFSNFALADTTPEDALDYRIAVMTVLRGHIGAASMIVRGLVSDDGNLTSHAEGVAAAATELSRIFPQGSNIGESDALPIIWEEPEAFVEAVSKSKEAAAAFVGAAASGDRAAIGKAFRNLGGSCRGCHDQYRVKN